MNSEMIFRLMTLGLILIAFTIGGYFRARSAREGGQLDKSQGQGLLIVLRLMSLTAQIPLWLYLINPAWVTWAQAPLPAWIRWTGVAVALAMVPFLFWMFAAIGTNISPTQATRADHQLVTRGPYRWIRHPLYTFGGIYFFAVTAVSALWWVAAWLALIMAVLVWRTPREEANLIARFGDEYRAYMTRTGRFFPRFG